MAGPYIYPYKTCKGAPDNPRNPKNPRNPRKKPLFTQPSQNSIPNVKGVLSHDTELLIHRLKEAQS